MTLELQTGYPSGSGVEVALAKLAQSYEKAHPNVHLNLVPATANYQQDLQVRIAAKNVPDIFDTIGWSKLRYSPFLANLSTQPWNKYVNPQLDSAMRKSSGAIYALPIDTELSGVIYNKTVLKNAGVDPKTLTTWSAFTNALAKIKASGKAGIESSEKADGPAGNFIDWLAPGFYSSAQLASLSKGEFVDGPYTKISDLVSSWQKAGYFNPDYVSATQDDMGKALAENTAAFVFNQNFTATTAFVDNPKAQLGFIPIPNDNGAPYFIGGEDVAFGVSKTSSHKQQAEAFLDYLAKPANDAALAQAAGAAPGLTNVKADLGGLKDSYETWAVQKQTPIQPYFDRVYLPNGMWNTLVTTMDSLITGQGTSSTAVAEASSSFKSLFAKQANQ